MPRRNHRRRSPRRRPDVTGHEPAKPTPDALAARLVARGLVSPLVLGEAATRWNSPRTAVGVNRANRKVRPATARTSPAANGTPPHERNN